jgi:hypothetical protein
MSLSLRGTALEVESQIDTLPDEMLLAVFEVVARIDPKTMLTVVHARGMSVVASTVRGHSSGVSRVFPAHIPAVACIAESS